MATVGAIDLLTQAASDGPLLISPVVFVECSAGFPSTAIALKKFELIQIHYDPVSPE